MNPNVIKMEYAVRGPLVIRAGEIEKEIKQVTTDFTSFGQSLEARSNTIVVGRICSQREENTHVQKGRIIKNSPAINT